MARSSSYIFYGTLRVTSTSGPGVRLNIFLGYEYSNTSNVFSKTPSRSHVKDLALCVKPFVSLSENCEQIPCTQLTERLMLALKKQD